MSESEQQLGDWRADWLSANNGEHVALLSPVLGEQSDEVFEQLPATIEAELRALLDQPNLATHHIDPSVGAGGFGIGVIWEVASRGADLFAWIGALLFSAGQIRKAAQYLSKRLGREDRAAQVFISGEAARALCVAELCERGVDPNTIAEVTLNEHSYPPVEPTVEKQQLYSAYTVTVAGIQPDNFFHVWSFLVTSRGDMISRGDAKVPIPNATHWFQVDGSAGKLTGLP
jgi:hypothetical protein